MRLFYIFIAIIGLTFSLGGCDNRPDVIGAWHGNTREVFASDSSRCDATTSITFNRDGSVAISSELGFALDMHSLTEDQLTVPARSSISGTWRYAANCNNQIEITPDFTTLCIVADPHTVDFSTCGPDDTTSPLFDTLRCEIAWDVQQQLSERMRNEYSKYEVLRNVTVARNLLTFALGDRDFTLRKEVEK